METGEHGRPTIAEIVHASGMMGGGERSEGDPASGIARISALLSGHSVAEERAMMAAAEVLSKTLKLHSEKALERTFAAPYAIAARALVLALHAGKYALTTAFDMPAGAVLEATIPRSILSLPGTMRFVLVDQDGSAMHVTAHSVIEGQLLGFGRNARALGDVFAKTEEYVKLLSP